MFPKQTNHSEGVKCIFIVGGGDNGGGTDIHSQ